MQSVSLNLLHQFHVLACQENDLPHPQDQSAPPVISKPSSLSLPATWVTTHPTTTSFPAGGRRLRPGPSHQILVGLPSQAWHQEGALVSLYWVRHSSTLMTCSSVCKRVFLFLLLNIFYYWINDDISGLSDQSDNVFKKHSFCLHNSLLNFQQRYHHG